jgi:hypothetical protein
VNLYIEHDNGRELTPEEQSGVVLSSKLRLATLEEIEESKKDISIFWKM